MIKRNDPNSKGRLKRLKRLSANGTATGNGPRIKENVLRDVSWTCDSPVFVVTASKAESPGEIVNTNFWDTALALAGLSYLSTSAKTFRLLVPTDQVAAVLEGLSTAREVIVSRGPWPQVERSDAFELLFEDNSTHPFSLTLEASCVDQSPLRSDHGREDLRFIAYGPGLTVLGDLPAKFRFAASIPCLAPWPRWR